MSIVNEKIEFMFIMLRSLLQVTRLLIYLLKSYESLKIRDSIEEVEVDSRSPRDIEDDTKVHIEMSAKREYYLDRDNILI